MYIHIGNNSIINYRDIIGVFDIENTSISKITKFFLFENEKENKIINTTIDIPKSFIVTKQKKGNFIYISQISSQTIKKRLFNI